MKEPSLENAKKLAKGWVGLDDIEKKFGVDMAIIQQRSRSASALAKVVFSTPEGEELLEYLMDRTVRRSPVPNLADNPIMVTFEQLAPVVTFCKGQSSIVQHILELISKKEA